MTKGSQEQIDESRLMLTVDPGGEHVGVALWFYYEGYGWRCDHAQEMNPAEFVEFLERYLEAGTIGTVVYESWQLYADKAMQQVGSELEVVQLIGVIKYLVSRYQSQWPMQPVQIFKQPAVIKTATTAVLRRKKVVSVAKRVKMDPDGHGFDAELHGYHFLGRNGLKVWYVDKTMDPTKPPTTPRPRRNIK